MASSKKQPVRQTAPVLDNSAAVADPNLEKSKIIWALSEENFNNVIRVIRKLSLDKVNVLGMATAAKLKELEINPDLSNAVEVTPKGSDQYDPSSVLKWIEGINPEDEDSIDQLLAIDATYRARAQ